MTCASAMGDRGGDRGGFRGGFGGDRGRGRGDRGRGGRGDRGRGRGRGRGAGDKEEWVPCTKIGRLVKAGKIKTLVSSCLCMHCARSVRRCVGCKCCACSAPHTLRHPQEHLFLFSMPIKEYEIVDYFLGPPGNNKIKDEVMKVQPVQKQTRAGQRTRFKAFVLVGDFGESALRVSERSAMRWHVSGWTLTPRFVSA